MGSQQKEMRPPRVTITDNLRFYSAANTNMKLSIKHYSHKGLSYRAKKSYQLTQRRETIMKRFKSLLQARRILSIHHPIANLFHCPRNPLSAQHY
jgi:putative transposase